MESIKEITDKYSFDNENMNEYIKRISTGTKTISYDEYMNLRD
jgi:hypothetical protein